MRYFLILLQTLVVSLAFAQTTVPFTSHLQEQVAGQGSVVLEQDEKITALVNHIPVQAVETNFPASDPKPAQKPKPKETSTKNQDTLTTHHANSNVHQTYEGNRVRHKTRGYRIQVYSGTGSSASKRDAKNVEAKVRSAYPELAVYCHFKAPRWICRVGDFATREEAQRYLTKIKSSRISVEATIVPDEVFLTNPQ